MAEIEETYSTAQIASSLNLTGAMVRKYALAVEEFSGEKINQTAKDGRKFSRAQYDTILKAKALIDNDRLPLNTAVRMALGQAELAPVPSNNNIDGTDALARLETVLRGNGETTQLLLNEIRGLRQDLRDREAPGHSIEPKAGAGAADNTYEGLLVRIARRIEKLYRS